MTDVTAQEPVLTADLKPLAYVYDRVATTSHVVLELRLAACGLYVDAKGWGVGGWWIDKGDDALMENQRPAFDALLNAMRSAEEGQPRVVLVHGWNRLAFTREVRARMVRHVELTGGWIETVTAETSKPADRHCGVLTAAPGPEADRW